MQRLVALGDSTTGYSRWIDEQLAQPASVQLPTIQIAYAALTNPAQMIGSLNTDRQEIWFRNSITGPDQLRQRVAFALSEIMVVSQQSTLQNMPHALADYYDLLARDAFGDFRKLIEDVTLHPGDGRVPQHARQPEARHREEHPPRRELRARADAAAHRRPRGAQHRRHRQDGRAGPAHPDLRPVGDRRLCQRLYRLELLRRHELRAGPAHAREPGAADAGLSRAALATREEAAAVPGRREAEPCRGPGAAAGPRRRARQHRQPPERRPIHLEAADPEAGDQQSVAAVRRARDGGRSTTTAAASAAISARW